MNSTKTQETTLQAVSCVTKAHRGQKGYLNTMSQQRGMVYEYCILFHPRVRKDKEGEEIVEKSKLIKDIERIVAASPQEVSIIASRAIPDEYLDKLDEVEIIVRPFGSA